LLLDEDVSVGIKVWLEGSKITADVSLRRLGLFCLEKGITPRQLIELARKKLRSWFWILSMNLKLKAIQIAILRVCLKQLNLSLSSTIWF